MDAFKKFATNRIAIGVLLAVVALWVIATVLGFFETPSSEQVAQNELGRETAVSAGKKVESHAVHTEEAEQEHAAAPHEPAEHAAEPATTHQATEHTLGHPATQEPPEHATEHATAQEATAQTPERAAEPEAPVHTPSHTTEPKSQAHAPVQAAEPKAPARAPERVTEHAAAPHEVTEEHKVKGVAFVEACIKPLDHELNERFWGWRVNDVLNLTDNVNNFQLGVLEVTRRVSVSLSENISRTGSTDAFNPNLENAVNWFMIKSDRYWFPSAESKYQQGLDDLQAYIKSLENKGATFFTRADNLIPLLKSFEHLMGSCDENLAKATEENGDPVSYFKSDDYLYYAKGVASSMATILEAIHHDFHTTLQARNCVEVLHHAIHACHHATEISPWLVLESSLSSIFANHRANMAAPISHARFYLGVLINTLST